MAEAVAGLLTSAVVNIAKAKLASVIGEQANLLCNFSGDLEGMRDVLETISAALEDAERRSVKESLVRLWLKRLKDAALDISDILEDYQDTIDQATGKMSRVLSCLPMAYNKIVMANRMKGMREKLKKITSDFDSFNFIQGTSMTIEQHHDDRETISRLPEEPIIGRDAEKQEIINMLYAGTNNNGISIVPIYGLGGTGKSTLAQLVYNDDQSKNYDHRIWVYVSQNFNLSKIGSSIICQLPNEGGQPNMDTHEVIYQRLHSLLHGKKVLVVLDDIWEPNMTMLGKLRNMLHVNDSMIHVIVTTRKEDIAKNLSTNEPYKLQPLEDDLCWEIIKRFSKFELKSNKENLERIGLDIANKCGGVALAAQAIGYRLQSINDLSRWIKIKNSDVWNESSDDNTVLPSLKLSYEIMPPQLRACFSYCAIFPKGHNIVEDELVYQWIGLDFIDPSKGRECIKILLGMSFLQVSKLPSASNVACYTMHDLVHDLARLTMADDLLLIDVTSDRDTRHHKYCRYSSIRKYDKTINLDKILPSKTRALRFSDGGKLDIPDSAFSLPKCLRTLDFSECSGILLPLSIGPLKQLRYLNAPRIQNDSLPKFITELPKLQYLNINRSSQISALPESVGNLECLEYLSLSGCSSITKLPESLGDLKCLVHLDLSDCFRISELPDSLGNLTNLQHLELSSCFKLQEIPESLCGLIQLQYLNLSNCGCLGRLPEAIGSLVGLQYLNMSWCGIRELPDSLMKLQNLLHLDVSDTSLFGSDKLDGLGNLTSLKYLILQLSMPSDVELVVDFTGKLTNLEHLDLSRNSNLVCLPESIGNLKRLHTLDLSHCCWLKSLPKSIGALGLKSLVLEGCTDELMDQATSLVHYSLTLPMFKVCADDVNGCSNLPQLEDAHHVSKLRILSLENARSLEDARKARLVDKNNLLDLTFVWNRIAVRVIEDSDLLGELLPPRGLRHMCLEGYNSTGFPGWVMEISHHLTNLVSISLQQLYECRELPPLGQLPHLQNLGLFFSPNIKKIDREFCGGKGAFRRLSTFGIGHMDGLEEWDTTYSIVDDVVEFMFPVLDRLVIQGCPKLRLKPCLPTFRECEIHTSYQVISSLEELPSHPSSRGTKLNLAFGCNCGQSMRIFHHFPALQELSISHNYLTGLPESMQHLTSLQSLKLQYCDHISALPEWLGKLSSLQTLVIQECKGIKSLPSCVQQLTKLEKLEIWRNQELKKWCESKENKMKLAHINFEFRYCD